MVDTTTWPTPARPTTADYERTEADFIRSTYGADAERMFREQTHCNICGLPRESRRHDYPAPRHEFTSIYSARLFHFRETLPGWEDYGG